MSQKLNKKSAGPKLMDVVTSALCFTRHKETVLFLVWRDKKSTLRHSDSTFWSGIPLVPEEDDTDEIHTVTRCLAEKTCGAFLRSKEEASESLKEEERIKAYQSQASKQLRRKGKASASTSINASGHRLWVVAVKYCSPGKLNKYVKDKGEANWVSAADMLVAVGGDAKAEDICLKAIHDCTVKVYRGSEEITLYLPFVAVLRSKGALNTVRALAKHTTKAKLPKIPSRPPPPEEKKEPKNNEKIKISENKKNKRSESAKIGLYLCRKCRRAIFTSRNIISHKSNGKECTALYLEEGDKSAISIQMQKGTSGKLICPNDTCARKIGDFSWPGSRCSCGVFVSPSCRVSKGKIELKVRSTVSERVIPLRIPTLSQPHDRPSKLKISPSISKTTQ